MILSNNNIMGKNLYLMNMRLRFSESKIVALKNRNSAKKYVSNNDYN